MIYCRELINSLLGDYIERAADAKGVIRGIVLFGDSFLTVTPCMSTYRIFERTTQNIKLKKKNVSHCFIGFF